MLKNYLCAVFILTSAPHIHQAEVTPTVINFYDTTITPDSLNRAAVFKVSKLICQYLKVRDDTTLTDTDKISQMTSLIRQIDQTINEYLNIYWSQSANSASKKTENLEDISRMIWISHRCQIVLKKHVEYTSGEDVELSIVLENLKL
jgi:hypothetical protein